MKTDNKIFKYTIIGCLAVILVTLLYSNITGYSATDPVDSIKSAILSSETLYADFEAHKDNYTHTILRTPTVVHSGYTSSSPSTTYLYLLTNDTNQFVLSSNGSAYTLNLSGYGYEFDSNFNFIRSGTYTVSSRALFAEYAWRQYDDIFADYTLNGFNYRGLNFTPHYSNSMRPIKIVYDPNIIATISSIYTDRVAFTIKVPHGFDISTLSLNTDVTYTLPSNQYVTDLVTDLRGIILDKRYRPIVNSTYKKTWGHSYTTRYRYNVTLMTEIAEHDESEIFGDTYYYSIPFDYLELGTNTLNHAPLSNINSYPEYVDGLVTAGYISKVTFYPYTITQQGVIKIVDTDDSANILVNYAVPKLESEVTSGDISAAQTQAYMDERTAEIDRRLQEYVYNPNIEAGQNIVEKLNSIVNTVTGMIGTVSGVGAMFALFFTCLPTFVLDIISFTIISLCIISIYKALRG